MRARLASHHRLVRLPRVLSLSRPLFLCILGLICLVRAPTLASAQTSKIPDGEIVKSRIKQPALEQAQERFEKGEIAATYFRLLEGYRAYDEAQARELGAFWQRLYDDPLVLDMLFAAIPIDQAPLSEMALTDLALAAFQRGANDQAEAHLQMAERFVVAHMRTPPEGQPESPAFQRHKRFAREWYLGLIWLRFAHLEYTDLYVMLDRARLKFPDDPDVLLSSGSEVEIEIMREHATAPDDRRRLDQTNTIKVNQMVRMVRATDFFRRAIALDPNAAEARIRLARLLASQHDRERGDEALTLLREAREIAKTPPLSYLAALFAGDIEEQRKNTSAAATWYRTAIAECPLAQTARLAQSHIQLDLNDGARGAINTLRPLQAARPKDDNICEPDPWRTYRFGQAWRLPAQINAMRKLAREITPPSGHSEP